MAATRKRQRNAVAQGATTYKNDWERLRAEPRLLPHQYRHYEPFLELSDTILRKLPDININRAFFVTTEHPIHEVYEALAFYILTREALRCEPLPQRAQVLANMAAKLPDKPWFRTITPKQLVAQLTTLRTTCVCNRFDRGSYRMRYCMSGVLALGLLRMPKPTDTLLTGAILAKAGTFAVLTGGPKMCKLIQERIAAFQFILSTIFPVGFFMFQTPAHSYNSFDFVFSTMYPRLTYH